MIKWEYLYVGAFQHRVGKINNKAVRETEYQDLIRRVEGGKEELQASDFLTRAGLEGWEVVGMCPASQTAENWRMILKRPVSE
ncbi:hypothetical protein ACFLW2_03505 [Chloroflexota bacterium]